MSKRCVIIGSGLGGLSCGVILSRNGYDVTVLEQGAQPGGCLQAFSRGGARFETGMHFLGSCDRGQVLHRLLRYLGVMDRITLSRLDPRGYDVISLGGERFAMANGREPFIAGLAERFPGERDNLRRYFELVEKVAGASSLHNLRHADRDTATLATEYQLRSIDDVLDRVIGDELLRNVLVGSMPLYAAERGKTPFATHAFITSFYNRSAFRVAGGSDSIARALVAEIESAGGRVECDCRATKIECDAHRATAVLAGDTRYEADIVIAAIHPARMLELCDSPLLRPVYRRRVASMPMTTGCFTVYIKFKPGMMPYMNRNFYGYRGRSPWGCELYTPEEWPKGYLYMHYCDGGSSGYATSGQVLSYMNYADVARWSGSRVGRRGNDYEDFKRAHAARLIAEVEREHPGFEASIEQYWTSTPLTYRDYTGSEGGSMYGIARDINLGPAARIHHRTRVPNLLLAGQNVNSHGILGVLVGTIVTCSELLTSETIFNQIMETEK